MNGSTATVCRARLPEAGPRAPSRIALQRWLAGIDLRRLGLPAEALVVVRQLRASPEALADPRRDPLADALRSAVRPAQQALVGAGVAVVWFADEAELLACLARDALGGTLAQRWWWPLLLGAAPTMALAQRRWAADARALPQALHGLGLEPQGLGEAWLAMLGPTGRAALLEALAQAWPLCTAVRQCVEAAEAVHAATPERAAPSGPPCPAEGPAPDAVTPPSVPPNAVQVLLRLAAVLRVEPHRAADEALVPTLQAAERAPSLAPWPRSHAAVAVEPPVAGRRLRRLAPTVTPARGAEAGNAGAQRGESSALQPAVASMPVAPAAPAAGAAATGMRPAPRAHAATDTIATAPLRLVAPSTPGLLGAEPAVSFHTCFGGVAFVLNAAIALGLYGDFTQPQRPGQPVSPWRLLHTAGRTAFGRAFSADPLALWLLARAGTATPAPLPWQLDDAALQPFAHDTRPWHAVAAPDTVRLWHAAGFMVAQHTAGRDVQALWGGLPRAQQVVVMHSTPRVWRPGLDTLLWPLLRARLALALGLPSGRAAAAVALALPARVQAGAHRLDLFFSLAALPLVVRLAGLDRDPGWLPAAGADIRFHFD